MLIVAMQGQMLGLARLAYSLATNRQIPSAAGRLSERRGTPYVAIALAAVIAFAFVIPHDLEFLAGVFAFGAMISFAIAHLSVIGCASASATARALSACRWASGPRRGRCRCRPCSACCSRGRLDQRGRAARGRPRDRQDLDARRADALRRLPEGPGQAARKRFTIPAEALQESPRPRVRQHPGADLGRPARRRHHRHRRPSRRGARGGGRGGAVVEALYVFEIPMSLPIDARVPEERVQAANECSRARRRWARSTRGWRWPRRWCGAARWARRSSRRPSAAGWRRSCSRPRSPRACAAARSSAGAAGARPRRGGDDPLRGGEGALQGDPDRAPAGRRRGTREGVCSLA